MNLPLEIRSLRMAQVSSRKETAAVQTVSTDNASFRVYKKYLPNIQKRDGRIVPFDFEKIVHAIHKAMVASNEPWSSDTRWPAR